MTVGVKILRGTRVSAAIAFAAGLVALAVANGPLRAQTLSELSPEMTPTTPSGLPDETLRAFTAFLDSLWPEARARGISRATFDRALNGLKPDPEILARLDTQPEHARTTAQYVAGVVSSERIDAGRRKLAELGPVLARIEDRYGVDRHVLLAVWGIESNFGTAMGSHPVVRSLATLAAGDRRRSAYWKNELLIVLSVLGRSGVAPDEMVGSWAGAMGHTQFMPASYAAHAVDFDGDGRRDIWRSVPDALASTASYLKSAGWKAGEPWGSEAVLPDGFDFTMARPGAARTIFEWLALGVKPPSGRRFPPASGSVQLALPAGADGPAFLLTRNFRVILRYNNATSYGLAVGYLADRIAGAPAIHAAWPATDRALDGAERRELQNLLSSRGFETGGIDGMLGHQTRAAIRAYQVRRGLRADGHPGHDLLEQLRRGDR